MYGELHSLLHSSVTFPAALSLSPQSRLPELLVCHCSWLRFTARYIRATSPLSLSLSSFVPFFQTYLSSAVFSTSLALVHSLYFIFVYVQTVSCSVVCLLVALYIQSKWGREILRQEINWDWLISLTPLSGSVSPAFPLWTDGFLTNSVCHTHRLILHPSLPARSS